MNECKCEHWQMITTTTDYYHVYPVNDLREHVLVGTTCWCKPVLEDDCGCVVHNALDQRELIEAGERMKQ